MAHAQNNPSFTGVGDLAGGAVDSVAEAISDDGAIVVGGSASASGPQAFRWTAAGGIVGLGDLPGGSFNSHANGVSTNGSVIVGTGVDASNESRAFRWTSGSGLVALDAFGCLLCPALAFGNGVSANGLVAVGAGNPSRDAGPGGALERRRHGDLGPRDPRGRHAQRGARRLLERIDDRRIERRECRNAGVPLDGGRRHGGAAEHSRRADRRRCERRIRRRSRDRRLRQHQRVGYRPIRSRALGRAELRDRTTARLAARRVVPRQPRARRLRERRDHRRQRAQRSRGDRRVPLGRRERHARTRSGPRTGIRRRPRRLDASRSARCLQRQRRG